MKKKFLSLLLALITSFGTMFAAVSINGLWYNLDEENGTAEIWKPVNNTYYGDLDIPASVTYNDKEYVVNSIGGSAFAWCSGGPTNVTIPNTVKRIGESAFSWCTDLTSISIPNSVTYIGKNAFNSCTNLTSITLPSSIDTIHEHTFDYCTNLVSVLIPNSVKCIGDNAFDDCQKLVSINIPNSVKSIGAHAFDGCNLLESIIIPDSVISIGKGAFNYCRNLTSVTIGKSVTDIGVFAFYDSGITSVEWKAIACNNFIMDDVLCSIFENTVQSFTFGDEVEIIPALLCEGMNQLTSITLPVSVTSIGERAFENCSNLVGDLVIPDNVVTIGTEAFSKCTNLSSVTIGKKVRTVGDYAFLSCLNLKSVNISDLSAWCTIKFGNSEANPLAGKLYLNGVLVTDLLIPNDVTCIENYVFRSCSLKSLKISENVTSIGEGAFWGCSGLTFITCEALNPPTLGSSVFYEVNKSIPLYVPAESITAYKTADQWKDFLNILPGPQGMEEIVENSSQDGKFIHDGQIFILRGEKIYSITGQEVK